MWFTYLDIFSFGLAIGGLGIMLVFWALNKYYKKRNNKHMENKYTKEYFSQFNVGDKVYFYNAQHGFYERAEVIKKSSVGYHLNGEHPRKNIKTIHQLVYASVEDLKEHQLWIIRQIEKSRIEKAMNIYASSHPDYFSITPGISIGHGWIMIDWLWFVVDITRGEIPF